MVARAKTPAFSCFWMRRSLVPPSYEAQSLNDEKTSAEFILDSKAFLSSWSERTSSHYTTAGERQRLHRTCQHADGSRARSHGCATTSQHERAPVPYAPVRLRWPHPSVLDLLVQQAMAPCDPNLATALSSSGRPCVLRPLNGRKAAVLRSYEVEDAIRRCSWPREKPGQEHARGGVSVLPEPALTLGFQVRTGTGCHRGCLVI